MGLQRIDATQAAAAINEFSAVIDARSESEFALDHLPRAQNWPTLTDSQRHLVGSDYAQASPFDARKRGAVMAARNIADHLEREAAALPKSWRPLVYCWRGGQRSGSLALVLGQIGFDVSVLDGGYQAFRRFVLADLEPLPLDLSLHIVCGKTGSGKTRLLQALHGAGAQVLDLEALACHRGSVLGGLPEQAQPGQKRFEMLLWQALRGFDRARPVFVESESRTVGRLRVPEALLKHMRAAPGVQIEMATPGRIELLMQDYSHLVQDAELLCERLQGLREARGAAVVERWQALCRRAEMATVVAELLADHYDPIYLRSMERNFLRFAQMPVVGLADGSVASMAEAAAQILAITLALPAANPDLRPGSAAQERC